MQSLESIVYKLKVTLGKALPFLKINKNRVPKSIWEQQYADTTWDYLEGEDERAHYEKIAGFYTRYSNNSSVLDIGCGKGVLYNYLSENAGLSLSNYKGLDISENAILAACEKYNTKNFLALDYQYRSLDERFGMVIFNETLYYFNSPIETLEKAFAENLVKGGKVIVSMCDYAQHNHIWELIKSKYKVVDECEVSNTKQQLWRIKVITE